LNTQLQTLRPIWIYTHAEARVLVMRKINCNAVIYMKLYAVNSCISVTIRGHPFVKQW
jgi:hypothetical protein